jgi:DNA (cytosine-5)-methyltransferase 1
LTSTKGSRGTPVELRPHPASVTTADDLGTLVRTIDEPLVVDLFCGAGGLSLGLERAGAAVVVGIDHDPYAIATHRAHHAGLSESWDLSDPTVTETIGRIVSEHEVALVCGGPPCQPFSRAGRGIIRSLVERGVRGEVDERRELWQAFLEVVRLGRPAAVLMENVPDMAFDRGMVIVRSVISELESWGYGVEARILDASEYGVPQMRRRLFIMAMRDGVRPTWPRAAEHRTTVLDALGDLPPFDGGWVHDGLGDDGSMPYLPPTSGYQRMMRESCGEGVFDHVTRSVREDDRRAFASMNPGTKYSDLDEELKRYRDDIFKDKYNRLDPHSVSRTITAHLARDGYAYIHPAEDRTISVREAARIQSFPDRIRFAGPPTAAFRQIGNAVPVLLGEALGRAILDGLCHPRPAEWSTSGLTSTMASFHARRSQSESLSIPWLAAETTWQLVACCTLDSDLNPMGRRLIWNLFRQHPDPADSLASQEALLRVGRQLGLDERMSEVIQLAERIVGGEQLGDVVRSRIWDLVCTLSPNEEEALVCTPAMVRVAARFFGIEQGTLSLSTSGRLLVAHIVGGIDSERESADAARGLIELAESTCTSADPSCGSCPLAQWCASADTAQLSLTG